VHYVKTSDALTTKTLLNRQERFQVKCSGNEIQTWYRTAVLDELQNRIKAYGIACHINTRWLDKFTIVEW